MKKTVNTESSASSGGYKYQDIVALEKVVSLLTDQKLKQVTLDAKNTPHIEDVVCVYENHNEFIQVKHSNDKNSNFTKSDLFSNEKSLFSKTFIGWRVINNNPCNIYILTNKKGSTQKVNGLSLLDIVDSIEKYRKDLVIEPNVIRVMKEDLSTNGLKDVKDVELRNFIKCLNFMFEYSSIDNLLNKIEDRLKCVIQTKDISYYLDKLYKNISIDATKPNEEDRIYTKEKVESILFLTKNSISNHYFNIPKDYVENTINYDNLNKAYNIIDSGYIFLKGKAGSGKTSFITNFLKLLYSKENIAVLRYYLFHFDDELKEDVTVRVEKKSFYYDLCLQLQEYLGNNFEGEKYLDKSINNFDLFFKNLKILNNLYDKVLIIIDGIDHAIRAKDNIDTLFHGLIEPHKIEKDIIFILSGQPNWENYPQWLKQDDSRQNILHIDLLPFELEHIKQYIINKDIWNDENLIDYISSKVLTLTKGFPLNIKIILEEIKNLNSIKEISNYLDNKDDIYTDLTFYYEKIFEDIKLKFFKNNSFELKQFQALLFLIKQPINVNIISTIFNKSNPFEIKGLLNYLLPVLVKTENEGYELFHNDIRVYLSTIIEEDEKFFILQCLSNYYLENIENEYSHRHLISYLFQLKLYDKIKEIINYERLDFKNNQLRDSHEIENELQLAMEVSSITKDIVFMTQVTLLMSQHDITIYNLEGEEELLFDNNIELNKDLYSFVAPSKTDLSENAINKRIEFFKELYNTKIDSLNTMEYFFNKFSIPIEEYFIKLSKENDYRFFNNTNEFLYYYCYFLIILDKQKAFAILENVQLNDTYDDKLTKNISYLFFDAYFNQYELNLENLMYLENNKLYVPMKNIVTRISILTNIDKSNKNIKQLLSYLVGKNKLNNEVIYLLLKSKNFDLLPVEYNIKNISEKVLYNREQIKTPLFKWAYIKTYMLNLKEPFSLFDEITFYNFSETNEKVTIWIGFLCTKKHLCIEDLKKLNQFIDNRKDCNYSLIVNYLDELFHYLSIELIFYQLNYYENILDDLEHFDKFLYYYYQWCRQYRYKEAIYTNKHLKNKLYRNIQGKEYSQRLSIIKTIINIKKELNENIDEDLVLARKISFCPYFRKDSQSYYFTDYFTEILKNDYEKNIQNILEFLYIEQFKENEYTERTMDIEDVLEKLLPIINKNSLSDLFSILNYFYEDKDDNKRLPIPSSLLSNIVNENVTSKEEIIANYTLYSLGTTFCAHNKFESLKNLDLATFNKNISSCNLEVIDIFNYKQSANEDKYFKLTSVEFLELIDSLKLEFAYLEGKEILSKNLSNKTQTLFYNIKYHPNLYFNAICELSKKQNLLEPILSLLPHMQNIDVNKLLLEYLKRLYSNTSENIYKLTRGSNFSIEILLRFTIKYLYSISASSVQNAIKIIVNIGKIYLDDTIEFIFKEIYLKEQFRLKIWLDILSELDLTKYSNQEYLRTKIIDLSQKISNSTYLLYSMNKILLNIGLEVKSINNIFYLDTPKKIIKVEDTIQSYKKFYITTDYDEVKQFIKKINKLTDIKEDFLFEKIEYFRQNFQVKSKYNTYIRNDIKLLETHSNFYKAQFIQWLYQEEHINIFEKDYLLQIIEGYDIKIIMKENYFPKDIILPLEYKEFDEKIEDIFDRINYDLLIKEPNKILCGKWEQYLDRNYIFSITLNSFLIDEKLFDEQFKNSLDMFDYINMNFGLDSYFINENYMSVDSDLFSDFIPLSSNSYCVSIFQNSHFYTLPSKEIIESSKINDTFNFNNYDTQIEFIKWDYANVYGDIYPNLDYQGYGQFWQTDLLSLTKKYKKNNSIYQIIKVNIFNKDKDESYEKYLYKVVK